MDRPRVSQFITNEQLGGTLKQVQEVVIQDVCEKMKVLECQPRPMRGFEYKLTRDVHLHSSKMGTVHLKQNQAMLEESSKLNKPFEGLM